MNCVKHIRWLSLVVLSALACSGNLVFGQGEDTPVIRFNPSTLTIYRELSGTVEIQVAGMTALAGFDIEVFFNSQLIEAVNVFEGDFLRKNRGLTFTARSRIDNLNGVVALAVGRITPGGVDGQGALARIQFRSLQPGNGILNLINAKLVNVNAAEIHVERLSGSVEVPNQPTWDVNNDGFVNIFDVVLVGQHFGENPPTDERVDANRDGVVNILDLVFVGRHYGEFVQPAAPASDFAPASVEAILGFFPRLRRISDFGIKGKRPGLNPSPPRSPAPSLPRSLTLLPLPSDIKWHTVHRALMALQQAPEQPGREMALIALQTWLSNSQAKITVEKTQLLENYPNPFNPETWIPYRLATGTDVVITIYDARGALIRRFPLGYQEAGHYVDKGRAFRWDGRSDSGERVSSGRYFYELRAGDYIAVKPMVILK